MQEIISKINEFNKEREWDQFHTPANLAKSISIEAAELLECFQWDDNKYNMNNVEEELADVLTYGLMMAEKLSLDPKEIILNKLEITKEKYPIEKSKGVSTKYDKL